MPLIPGDGAYLVARGAVALACLAAAGLGLRETLRTPPSGGRRPAIAAGAALLALAGCFSAYDAVDNILLRPRDPVVLSSWVWLALDLMVPGWFVLLLRSQRARDEALRRLAEAAVTDPLTGLLNRRGFFERAGPLLGLAERDRQPAAVLAFDLDHFKRINDGWGHAAGDAVLRGFGRIVATAARGQDLAGRFGGEEFVLLMPSTSPEAAAAAAERIRAEVAARVAHPGGAGRRVTVSVGVAPVRPGSGGNGLEPALAAADAALYAAKQAGRDRVVRAGTAAA